MSEIPPTAAEGANDLNSGPETPAPVSPGIQTGERLHRSSLSLALLSGLGLALSVLIGLALFMLGVVDLTRSQAGEAAASALVSIGWVSLMVAVLQVPSLVLSIRRLRGGKVGPEAPVRRGWLAATAALVLMIPLVALGGLLAPASNTYSLLFLPPLQLLVVGVPIWWAFETGRRGLKGGTAQRGWGVVSVSTLITMPVVLVFELVAMVILGVVVLSFLAAQPQVMRELQNLFQTLSKGSVDPQAVSQLIDPYLKQPGFIFLVVVAGSALVPLLEEGLKPLALWPQVAGRKMTPSQGFTAGLICGAIFALLESLFSLSPAMGADWSGVVIGRMGTGLLHVTCSGLVGWGLALAWRREKYLQLGGLYLSAVFLHGSWNAISLLAGFSAAIDSSQSGPIAFLGQHGNLILVFMVVVDLCVLLAANRYLRTHPEQEPDPAAPLPPAPPVYDPFASYPPAALN